MLSNSLEFIKPKFNTHRFRSLIHVKALNSDTRQLFSNCSACCRRNKMHVTNGPWGTTERYANAFVTTVSIHTLTDTWGLVTLLYGELITSGKSVCVQCSHFHMNVIQSWCIYSNLIKWLSSSFPLLSPSPHPPPNFLKYKTIVHIIISYLLISNYQKNFFFLPLLLSNTPPPQKKIDKYVPTYYCQCIKEVSRF